MHRRVKLSVTWESICVDDSPEKGFGRRATGIGTFDVWRAILASAPGTGMYGEQYDF